MDLHTIRQQLNMGIPLSNINLKVTDYARVSTDHIEQQKSLKNQVEHFEQYIKSNPCWTYVSGYIDDGITGTSDIKRDNFMKMIEDARLGKFDLIVTKEISRFSRNTLDSIKYTRELLSFGVAVLFVNDNINTALPDSELRLTIMASMAQDEVRRLSERVKFGMHRAIERGEILGNNKLYGYKKDKNTGNLIIIEKEANIVKKIYTLYTIEKLSLSKIVNLLNEENLYKKWTITSISRMIENPKYKGYYCAKKSEIEDYMTKKIKYFTKEDWILYKDIKKIPPIIEETLWERANARLTSRKKTQKKEKTFYKDRYLYSAKIYCKEHNKVFHRRKFRKKTKDITWVCSEYLKKGKLACDTPNIRESELNSILKDIIKILNIEYSKILNILMSYYKNKENKIEDQIILRKKALDSLFKKKDRLLELNIEDIITKKEFKEKNEELNKQINNLTLEINKLKNNSNSKRKNNSLEENIKNKINKDVTQNKTISLLLDYILVSKINNDKNKLVLDIFLTYKKQKEKKSLQMTKDYEFKRGYDTKGTKRYTITYQVNIYF